MLLLLTRKILFFYLFLVLSPCAWAAKWELTPSVSATYTYSDNINLSQNNRSGDAALSLNPRVLIKGEGGRIDLTADYGLQVIRYRDNSQSDEEFHSAGLDANIKLVPDSFHVETNARYGQQATSLTAAAIPQNNLAITSNRTNLLTYQIKPVYRGRIGNKADVQVDYTYDGVQYDNNSIQDQHVRNTNYHVGLNSTEAYSSFAWSLNHNRTDFNVQNNDDTYYSLTDLTLRYRIAPKLSLIAGGGDEENHISNSLLGPGDAYWSGGFSWVPTSRTSIEVTRGERFYGNSTTASILSAGKNIRFNLTYDESITTTTLILPSLYSVPGQPLVDVENELVLQEALNATLSGSTAKTDYGVTFNKRKITYQEAVNRENYSAYSVFWNWSITPRSTVGLNGTRQVTDFLVTNQEIILDSYELSFERSFGRRGTSSFQYTNYQSSSSNGLNDYKSNLYQFILTWNFR